MHKIIRIADMDIKYQIDYRSVRYPRLEFKTGNLLLVLPSDYKEDEEELGVWSEFASEGLGI